MKNFRIFLVIIFVIFSNLFASVNFRVMTYNALNFDGTSRLSDFQTVFEQVNPDIIICQEISSEAGSDLPDSISTSDEVDSIYPTKKGNSKELNINDETLKRNPLADKKYGIEVNLLRLLFGSFSGGVSFFNIDRHAEITFQIYYIYYIMFDYYCDVNRFNFGEIPLQQLILDCHYRRFLGKTQKGFFISGFIRYAYLRGLLQEDLYNYCYYGGEEPKLLPENKIGVGFGVGYRIFSKKRFYWGVSLYIGRYFIGENNRFYHKWYDPTGPEKLIHPTADFGIIYSFELFKFGWAF